ncbi:hypothetical protein N7493_000705 [Penicillium malachiteum]|uniref:Uncharacterized protein n=1 Tax=Penicillium malachiteum TaxID=1324776 RepID=A0AAD6N111_9EURO|nr:hypothetical protein N7493_000705 [Penicillium malachiteum]
MPNSTMERNLSHVPSVTASFPEMILFVYTASRSMGTETYTQTFSPPVQREHVPSVGPEDQNVMDRLHVQLARSVALRVRMEELHEA